MTKFTKNVDEVFKFVPFQTLTLLRKKKKTLQIYLRSSYVES